MRGWIVLGVLVCAQMAAGWAPARGPVRSDWCRKYTKMRYWPARTHQPRLTLKPVGYYTPRNEKFLKAAVRLWNEVFYEYEVAGGSLIGFDLSSSNTVEFYAPDGTQSLINARVLSECGDDEGSQEFESVRIEVWPQSSERDDYMFLSILLHELGHALGLKHIPAVSSVMQAHIDQYENHIFAQLYPFVWAEDRHNLMTVSAAVAGAVTGVVAGDGARARAGAGASGVSGAASLNVSIIAIMRAYFQYEYRKTRWRDILLQHTHPGPIDQMALTCLY